MSSRLCRCPLLMRDPVLPASASSSAAKWIHQPSQVQLPLERQPFTSGRLRLLVDARTVPSVSTPLLPNPALAIQPNHQSLDVFVRVLPAHTG